MTSGADQSELQPADDEFGQLIRDGASLSRMAFRCGGIKNAMSQYGQRMSAMFPPAPDTSTCSQCGRTEQVKLAECNWLGVHMAPWMLPIMGILMVFGWHLHVSYHVKFRTYHALCGNYLRKLRLRRIVGWIMYIFSLLSLTAGIVILGLLMFDPETLFSLAGIYGGGNTVVAACIGVAALILGIALMLGQDYLPLPSTLAFVRRSPFNLASVKVT